MSENWLRVLEAAIRGAEYGLVLDDNDADKVAQYADEIERLRGEIAGLKDPATVWVNMLRGEIARPRALDHYEELKAKVERLEQIGRGAKVALDTGFHLQLEQDVLTKNKPQLTTEAAEDAFTAGFDAGWTKKHEEVGYPPGTYPWPDKGFPAIRQEAFEEFRRQSEKD